MRKTLLILVTLLVSIFLIFTACGSEPATPTPEPTPQETPAPAPEPEPMPKPEPEPTPEPEPIHEPEPPSEPEPESPQVPEADIPIIDAHSQVCPENLEKVIQLMDEAGVACTILSSGMTSTIGIVTPEELVSFASNYPGRIIPAVRIKVGKGENYYELLEKQMNMYGFGAMAEVLMYHALPPLIVAHPDDESVQAALNYALDKEWPFIVHIEFVAAGSQRDVFMAELKALLVQYPEHPFVLIHMGQLDYAAVRQLIEAHDNIYFITSASTPIAKSVDSPWTNMFDGRNLSADWKQLMIDHPDRFIMGFDMVFPKMWGQFYLDVVALWREAIKELPIEVAHALAHGNAERLWYLQGQPPEPEPTLTPDTTPPSEITGLIAADAYDGRVNLCWDKCAAADFARYNIYVNQAEIADTGGMEPVYEITASATNTYHVTGLEDGTVHYFAVIAVDKSGNEDTLVTCVSATPTSMPRGTVDPDISVDVYKPDKAWAGTTLLPDNHIDGSPRVIEVNMLGEIIWQYVLPDNLKQYTNPGFDVELLANNNILLVLPRSGVHEINRNGDIVWSYLTKKISHDADRLPNGNTIFVFGADDQKDDAQVTEVNPEGEIVWTWYARDHFNESPYKDIYSQGWTHTNAVTRLPNGSTFISLRNFSFVVEVDPQGSVIRTIGEGILGSVHDPAILPNGNLLATCTEADAQYGAPCVRAVEIDTGTGEIVWQFTGFKPGSFPVRDANRLPNGNTLITGSTKIVEVTPEGKIVWQLTLKGITFVGPEQESGLGFYKAERVGSEK